jgi:hypothetical protein
MRTGQRGPNLSNEEEGEEEEEEEEAGGMQYTVIIGWSVGQMATYLVDIFSPTIDPRWKNQQHPLKQKTLSASGRALPPVGFPASYEHSCLRCGSENHLQFCSLWRMMVPLKINWYQIRFFSFESFDRNYLEGLKHSCRFEFRRNE